MSVTYSVEPYTRWSNAKSLWVVTRSFKVIWKEDDIYLAKAKVLAEFTVPRGFETDGPSIPRRLRGVVSAVGNQFQPAIAHDFTYLNDTGLTKKQADQLFLDGMKSLGVPWYRRRVMYLAVRSFGKGHWG